MLQISEIVKKTEEMFDLFNEHFYHGGLNRPAITVSPDGGRGAYGWCSIQEIWNMTVWMICMNSWIHLLCLLFILTAACVTTGSYQQTH